MMNQDGENRQRDDGAQRRSVLTILRDAINSLGWFLTRAWMSCFGRKVRSPEERDESGMQHDQEDPNWRETSVEDGGVDAYDRTTKDVHNINVLSIKGEKGSIERMEGVRLFKVALKRERSLNELVSKFFRGEKESIDLGLLPDITHEELRVIAVSICAQMKERKQDKLPDLKIVLPTKEESWLKQAKQILQTNIRPYKFKVSVSQTTRQSLAI